MKTIEARAFEHIAMFADRLSQEANKSGEPCGGEFNEVELTAQPQEDPADIVARYRALDRSKK